MYKIEKLTVKNRCEIPVGSVVEVEVAEEVDIPYSEISTVDSDDLFLKEYSNYATIHIRKTFAKQGLLQLVTTPLPEGVWKPLIVVQNNGVSPIELRAGDEIASVWIFTS